MKYHIRILIILLLAVLMALAFLSGSVSAGKDLATSPGTIREVSLTHAEWAAVQAGNSLLSSGYFSALFLPVIVLE